MRPCSTFTFFLMGMATIDCFAPSPGAQEVPFALSSAPSSSGQGFGAIAERPEKEKNESLTSLSIQQIKGKLLDLLPRMSGTKEDFRLVEDYVNTLEDKHAPPQTLDFLNLAMGGEWQLLFSTNLSKGPRPTFRLKELTQTVEPKELGGAVVNKAQWDLSQGDDGVFDCSGTFSIICSYKINQGARMIMDLQDQKIELARGSTVPEDVQGLVGQLHRALPTELFDPSDHAMDTTYLDGDLRVVRMTGPKFEGVRDIFIRVGSIAIDPVGKEDKNESTN